MAEEQAELPTEDHEMEEERQTSEKEDESEDEESDDEEYFEVEKIMARKKRDGIFLYRVRWKGYPPSNDTWEPVDNLDVVADMVQEFDAKEEEKAKARQEERRLRKLRMEGKKLPGEESSDSSSSDDERLLNEDTKFFKMLEKNKDIVFGQPDLYSKVKSRAATLANKKKTEESQKESSAATSKSPQSQPAKIDGSRGRGRSRQKEQAKQVKSANQNKRSRMSVSKDSEEESDDSPVRKKAAGRGRGRPKKKISSEEDSDDSSCARKGRGRGRPKKKAIIEDSDENETDSDDSVPLRSNIRRSIGGPRKKFRIESSEENGSDSSLAQKKQSQSANSSHKKQTTEKAQMKKRLPSPVSEKGTEKSSSESEEDKETDVKPKQKETTEAKVPAKGDERSDRVSPAAGQDKADKTKVKTDSAKPTKADSAKPASASSRDAPSKSSSPKTSPVQARVIVPVLEKLAMSSELEGTREDATKESLKEEKALSPCSRSKQGGEKNVCSEKGQSRGESMEIETSEKKEDSKESKKKSSSRKRKQDTAVEHTKAVNEGEASPVKTSPLPPHSPPDGQPPQGESDPPILSRETRTSEASSEDVAMHILPPVLQRSTQEKRVPPLRITVPKLKIEPPKLKPESPKPYLHHSPKSQTVSGKSEKVKLKGDIVKPGKHEHHTSASVLKASHTSKRPPSRENVPEPAPAVTFLSSCSTVTTGTTSSVTKKDVSRSVTTAGTGRPDLSLKLGRTLAVESASVKQETVSLKIVKSESVDKTGRSDQVDLKTSRIDTLDSRRKNSSSSDLSSLNVTVTRDSSSSTFTPSSVKDLPSPSRDTLLSGSSRNTSGVFSSASTSRETSSLYSHVRDSSISGKGGNFTSASSRDLTHTSTSFRDPHLGSGSSRDSHLVSGSSRDLHPGSGSPGDIRLVAGYIHLSSGSSRDSLFSSSRDSHSTMRGDPKDLGCAGGSRHSLNSSISGKENADRQHFFKSLSSVPKKGDTIQPLDTILNSALYAVEGDRSRQYKGLDSDFDLALQRIDLEYLEKLLLPPVAPMELSDEELRQAVIDGNCYLVERALACSKPYNLNLPDNKGYTLLMNAVLRGSDDIIVHLLSRGADAQVQVNGVTALMLAVEHAESSTVFMLLEMGAHVNAADHSGETALFKAVRRGDKQILKLILDHGANFSLMSRIGLSPLQMAKQFRLADVETTLIDHIHKVVRSFEEQVNLTVRGTAKLVSCLFPHHCVPLYESDTITIPFKYQPSMPTGPGMGCLLFIAHARFNPQEVKCRLYGQCAVERVTLNGVVQPSLTEESNFVLMCHPLITGWNELVIQTKKDPVSKAKLIVCAYKAQLIYK